MELWLIKGYIDQAATSLADAQALLTALTSSDPSSAANIATINRITAKLETLVQSDSGEPLTVSSIDDTAGTISSWVTDASTTLAVGLGDQDPQSAYTYASTTSFTISGDTRVGTLALNTTALRDCLSAVSLPRPLSGRPARGAQLFLHIRKTTASGVTETVGLLSLLVLPGVLSSTPQDLAGTTYLELSTFRAGAVRNESGITSLTGGGSTALDGLDAGSAAYPVGCIVMTSNDDIARHWKLKGTYIAATSADLTEIKPTNSDATLNPVHWKLI